MLKFFVATISHEVSLCGGRIYNLYIDVTVVLALYVLSVSECVCVSSSVHTQTRYFDYMPPEDNTIVSKHVGV